MSVGIPLIAVVLCGSGYAWAKCQRSVEYADFKKRGGETEIVRGFNYGDQCEFHCCGRLACKGFLDFKFLINEQGAPTAISILRITYTGGPKRVAAVKARVAQMRYRPPRLNGAQVCVWHRMRLKFEFTE
jgi:hypothetical protein